MDYLDLMDIEYDDYVSRDLLNELTPLERIEKEVHKKEMEEIRKKWRNK